MKLRLGDLEQLRKDPGAFATLGGKSGCRKPTKSGILKDAVFRYHRTNSSHSSALEYMLEKFDEKFPGALDVETWLNDLRTYDAMYKLSNCRNIKVQVNRLVRCGSVTVTGQIPRLDLVRPGPIQYAGLLLVRGVGNWRQELRMPLLQLAIAEQMKVSSDSVMIGVYDFAAGGYEEETFAKTEITAACAEVVQLGARITQLGLAL